MLATDIRSYHPGSIGHILVTIDPKVAGKRTRRRGAALPRGGMNQRSLQMETPSAQAIINISIITINMTDNGQTDIVKMANMTNAIMVNEELTASGKMRATDIRSYHLVSSGRILITIDPKVAGKRTRRRGVALPRGGMNQSLQMESPSAQALISIIAITVTDNGLTDIGRMAIVTKAIMGFIGRILITVDPRIAGMRTRRRGVALPRGGMSQRSLQMESTSAQALTNINITTINMTDNGTTNIGNMVNMTNVNMVNEGFTASRHQGACGARMEDLNVWPGESSPRGASSSTC